MPCESKQCCSHGSQYHGHGNSAESSCGCSCQACTCKCPCECHKKQRYSDQLLNLADEAWMEVLKEKIKQEIARHSGEHLNQMAKLITETNHKRWIEKLQEKHALEEFDSNLRALLYQKKTGRS